MKFDKNRVYTAVNADELKPGDRVIVADTISGLREHVENDFVSIVDCIASEDVLYRFQVVYKEVLTTSALAYLVERKDENKDEIINKLKNEIKELKAHCRAVDDVNTKMKNCTNCKYGAHYNYYRDKKCCMCSSKYSKWELKEE